MFSEKEDALRATLNKLDSFDEENGVALTAEDLTLLRRQLSESQSLIRETADRLRQSQEENELALRRRDDVEQRLATLETEYEELLEKTIHDEETSNADLADSMGELKVPYTCDNIFSCSNSLFRASLKRNTMPSEMPKLARFKISSSN